MMILMGLRENLKAILDARGLSVYELARMSGVAANHLGHVMQGRILAPRGDTLKKLAVALKISTDDLLAEEPGALREGRPRYGNHDAPRPLSTVTVPIRALVVGGHPAEALENTGETFELLRHLAKPGSEVVKMVGNSMFPLLRDGYIVLVEMGAKTRNRDVIVARVNGESTIKRFYRDRGRVTLRAENPDIPPIVIEESDDFQIVGKVTEIVKGAIE